MGRNRRVRELPTEAPDERVHAREEEAKQRSLSPTSNANLVAAQSVLSPATTGRRRHAELYTAQEDIEAHQLREAFRQSQEDERQAELQRERQRSALRDAELASRLSAAEEARRAAAEREARRVAAEALKQQQQQQRQWQQLAESRRLVAVESFVRRAAVALDEWAQVGQLRRAVLTIGVAAAAELLDQTLLLEAAGGVLRNDGSGLRRTAGGVFFGVLLRENLTRDEYKYVQEARATSVRATPAGEHFVAYLRNVPPSVTPKQMSLALSKRFGPTAAQTGNARLTLKLAGEAKHGRVYFLSREAREAAVSCGWCEVGGGRAAVQAEATVGLHHVSARRTAEELGFELLEAPDEGAPNKGAPAPQAVTEAEPWMLVDDETLAAAEDVDRRLIDDLGAAPVEEWCPDDFICPITLMQLTEPVVAADGLTYERAALQDWLDKHAEHRTVLSPATGAPLAHRNLSPNVAVLEKMASVGRLASWLRDDD